MRGVRYERHNCTLFAAPHLHISCSELSVEMIDRAHEITVAFEGNAAVVRQPIASHLVPSAHLQERTQAIGRQTVGELVQCLLPSE